MKTFRYPLFWHLGGLFSAVLFAGMAFIGYMAYSQEGATVGLYIYKCFKKIYAQNTKIKK